MRLASDTDSLRSMSVPSDLQRGREELLVVLALIRWAAMFLNLFAVHRLVHSGSSVGYFWLWLSPMSTALPWFLKDKITVVNIHIATHVII